MYHNIVYLITAIIDDYFIRYSHLDLIYLNAGILPVSHVDWTYFMKTLFTRFTNLLNRSMIYIYILI